MREALVLDSGGHFGSVFPSGLWEHWVFIGLALHPSNRHERIVSMGTADVTIASGDKLSQWLRISDNDKIEIGARIAPGPLPHHRTCGSALGGLSYISKLAPTI